MKNFPLPATKRVTGYTWLQTGFASYAGNARLENRLESSASLGAIIHFNDHKSNWIQESHSQGGHGAVVHHYEHWLHVELESLCGARHE
jgi:hypothetical protein